MTPSKIVVTTVIAVSEEIKKILEPKLKARFGEFPITYSIDESLISGMVISFGDTELHFDLKNEVEYILNELIK
ncbi:MAG: hypothetical protein OHK0017_10760 [Patescibacteria group bacterium]